MVFDMTFEAKVRSTLFLLYFNIIARARKFFSAACIKQVRPCVIALFVCEIKLSANKDHFIDTSDALDIFEDVIFQYNYLISDCEQ